MANQCQIPKPKYQIRRKYDLEERTAQFGEAVIQLVKTLRQGPINNPLVSQIVRASTSIGANYMEADGAESKKDFQHKISICKKEAKETRHWLRMIARANPGSQAESQALSKEARELSLIFSSILLSKKQSRRSSLWTQFVIQTLLVIPVSLVI